MSAEQERGCQRCGGTGWVLKEREGRDVVVRCDCRDLRALERRLAASRIPERYRHCTIDGFEIWPVDAGERSTLSQAKRRTREFVDAYPRVDRGLLFMGPTGTGKTHLAVAALRELVTTKKVDGLYANAVDLVQELQMSFDGGGRSREEIIQPVVDADLLVLDELGGGKLSPWVQDLLYYVINSRYMGCRITLATSNYSDHPGSEGTSLLRTSESLADRISLPLRSRLNEMCDQIDIRCKDDFRNRSLARRRVRP